MIRLSYDESLAFKKMGFKENTDWYFVKKRPIESHHSYNWNKSGDSFVAMLNVYQAVDFLSIKKGIYISISVHTNPEIRKVELMTTVTYTRDGYITCQNELGNRYTTIETALYAGVKNVLETLNKL
jgi:hypothetical protein|uniref:Uncharacterized protein n=1 Tax=Podoviridae sp. ctZkC8 TaxID=2825259 RepID=A0A8S5UBL1_9CAUD|nr:MAG TPA: hypothetical protein [Podoviridae sp. ctZkC8]